MAAVLESSACAVQMLLLAFSLLEKKNIKGKDLVCTPCTKLHSSRYNGV
jgi:hypothetical protein